MVTCNDCIHSCVCPIADGCEYADEQHIRDDCEYFIPTADVVSKSKYDLAVAEREANVKGFTEELAKVKAEVAREIFEEIGIIFLQYYKGLTNGEELKLLEPIKHAQEFLLNELVGDIANLKKKYTEGDLNGITKQNN
jgi:hypothetical protein